MAFRNQSNPNPRLCLTSLEDRVVPAGMIEVIEEIDVNGTQLLRVLGDNSSNQIRVSTSGDETNISSTTGPIKYTALNGQSAITNGPLTFPTQHFVENATRLFVHGLNGDDTIEVIGDVWAEIQISSDAGNDRVYLDVMTEQCGVGTGGGSDTVELWNSQVRYLDVATGLQNDRVVLGGVNSFHVCNVNLGGGSDVLEGDTSPGSGLLPLSRVAGEEPKLYLNLFGGDGKDKLVNAAYFQPAGAVVSINDFESIR